MPNPCGAQLPHPWVRGVGRSEAVGFVPRTAAFRPATFWQFEVRSNRGICLEQRRRHARRPSDRAVVVAQEGPHEPLLSVQWALGASPASARLEAVLLNPMPGPIQNRRRTYDSAHQGMGKFPLPKTVKAIHSRAWVPSAGSLVLMPVIGQYSS
jgi:hypothetical protein